LRYVNVCQLCGAGHNHLAGWLTANPEKLPMARKQIPTKWKHQDVPFSYLRNLRFQGLRIDNSFIHDIDTHEDNRFYIESVVAIAHSRGVKVFATGVETAAEYSVLCELGIDGAMGYHLGRPFAADNQQTGD
jgi:hypothetical protein